jgi:formamidopyrimidine-DNA glycosylase
MPELPEVETTVKDLRKKVLHRTFIDVWTDFEKMIKNPKSFPEFKKELINKKILDVKRRAKFILFKLSCGKTLLIHQKMTGHLLLSKWQKQKNSWKGFENNYFSDKINSYIHLLFTLDDGRMLALSDLRKFARIELRETKDLFNSEEFKSLGPEPLEKDFSFLKFKERLRGKKGKIKQILMDPNVIAGIGNIYSDEILFQARIHPFRLIPSLKEKELRKIYKNIIKVLKKGIELRGESFSDWRTIEGKKGLFDDYRKVYQREGEKCSHCRGIILRKKIGGRSAHFCPNCQKL